MEAVKNRLTSLRRYSGAFIVDANEDVVADSRNGDFNETAWRRKADGIVDDRVNCTGKPVGLAHHDGGFLARSCKSETRVARFAATLPALHQLFDQLSKINSLKGGAGEFGVGACCLADVADQSVEPCNILQDDRSQLSAQHWIVDNL